MIHWECTGILTRDSSLPRGLWEVTPLGWVPKWRSRWRCRALGNRASRSHPSRRLSLSCRRHLWSPRCSSVLWGPWQGGGDTGWPQQSPTGERSLPQVFPLLLSSSFPILGGTSPSDFRRLVPKLVPLSLCPVMRLVLWVTGNQTFSLSSPPSPFPWQLRAKQTMGSTWQAEAAGLGGGEGEREGRCSPCFSGSCPGPWKLLWTLAQGSMMCVH